MTERAPTGGGLRLCYVLHRFPHTTETFITREMAALEDQGVDVLILSLMSPRTDGAPEDAERLMAKAVYARSASPSVVAAQLRALVRSPVRYVRALAGVIRKTWREPRMALLCLGLFPRMVRFAEVVDAHRVDHVHAHFVWIEGVAAGVIRELTGTTFSVNPHAFGLFTRPEGDVRATLEAASLVTTISNYNRDRIREICPSLRRDVEVVHCGVDPTRYDHTPRHRAPGTPLRILSIGRAVEKKGHEVLLSACRGLIDAGVEIDARIVTGRGGLREELDRRVGDLGLHDSVRLLDSMPEDRIRELMRWADVFALACVVAESGDRDGIPVVLMEAMAGGLPVVTTSVSGITELVEDGVNGLVVAPGDVDALIDAIASLAGEPARRNELGSEGVAKVRAEFSVEPNAARLRGVVEDVVAVEKSGVRP